MNIHMNNIKVVSFDVEGTLVTPDFSAGMWYECIPEFYSVKTGLSIEQARDAVVKEYERVGDGKLEWYDPRHWFEAFGLGDYKEAFHRCLPRIKLYPEAAEVVSRLAASYRVIVVSASVREFLEHLIEGLGPQFEFVVSTVSDYHELKTPELYRRVCDRLGVEPSEVVHVGDNHQYDFVNPAAAGMLSVHLDREGKNNGPRTVRDLRGFVDLLIS